MRKAISTAAATLAIITSCTMENPLLTESKLPYGAPQFDKIKLEHYEPAFIQGIAEAKAEIDAIVANEAEPDFDNTILALELSGKTLGRVSGIFYNLLEADADEKMQDLAEKISPMMTEYSMYVSLNEGLFSKVKAVYEKREELKLEPDQLRLLEKTYKGFVRGGANLSDEDKKTFSALQEELSLASLQFGRNALAATNAFTLNLTDEDELEGLPEYVREMGAEAAREKGQEGWTFDLTRPSYGPFMQFSARRDLREKMYRAYATKAVGGEFDNTEICCKIADLHRRTAELLGYPSYADYVAEDRMVGSVANIYNFLGELLAPALPVAREEVAMVGKYAAEHGFDAGQLQSWDFSYWAEQYKNATFDLTDEMLKPYFKLENCIDAVFGLAGKLYGVQFEERKDIPVYHKDVRVYDVKDADGRHLALFYADFFPRATKRAGAWMTEFRGQSISPDGVESRPLVSIVCNFSKPTSTSPSLLTHDELTTFLHEFGHSLHGMLAEGRYESLNGTSVDHDFVELPSQIMENWGFEKAYLKPFAKHYQTGEEIPDELIDKIIATKNYLSAYYHLRQLQFGYLDMAWYTLKTAPSVGTLEFEKSVYEPLNVLPPVEGACQSVTFSHIFSGGYSAGYYSYKWAEVLEADAFSLFQEKGIFSPEVASSFRENILSKGSTEDESVIYRRFRGHDPEPRALLVKLGIVK
ncbi:MAG: M3 family metallopeptidase [Bacteroidales bacterium]|nr:M3 family metallopeptidase [Candidatus Cryptobacteroides equifaecalis]